MRTTSKYMMVLGTVMAMAATACGSSSTSSTAADTRAAPTATAPAAQPASESSYATKTFDLPFDVDLPVWLRGEPSEEHAHFVTWESPSDLDRKVRFLLPVSVYPPGGAGPIAPPQDYLAYLLSQADHGAHFSDITKSTVGDRPATLLTATVDDSLDGSLGCPDQGMTAADCFGLQPDFVLRLAVIDAGDETLLVWLRNNLSGAADMAAQIDSFNRLLATVRFSDRAVEAPPATAAETLLDGTYIWTITPADALAHGTADDKQHLEFFPSDFSVAMTNGNWAFRDPETGDPTSEGGGTYTIDGDHLAFHWRGSTLTFIFSIDGDGTMHLDPQPPMNDGDKFIWSTEPWNKTG